MTPTLPQLIAELKAVEAKATNLHTEPARDTLPS